MTDFKFATSGVQAALNLRNWMARHGTNTKGFPLWFEKDNKRFRALYPDYSKLQAAFPKRSLIALRWHARILHLTKPVHMWTCAEVLRLRKLFPRASRAEVEAAFPHLRWKQIAWKAYQLRLRRPRKQHVRIGVELVDAVLEEAIRLNYTARDLDALVGSKGFFRYGCWKKKRRIQRHPCYKAVLALGGTIEVKFPD